MLLESSGYSLHAVHSILGLVEVACLRRRSSLVYLILP